MDKEFILQEIRRTAAANDGVALGKLRFFRETGIKEADWRGRYWLRWGDAVKEAGFQPNQKNVAIADEELVKLLIALIREIGHFPLTAEIRIKARSEVSFPSLTTFARLGNKDQLAAKVLDYCRGKPDYEDVVALCGEIANGTDEPEITERRSDEVLFFGSVYLLKFSRYYKIGRTNSVGRRERELAIQLPEKAKLVHSIQTDDPAGIEAYWHKRFEDRRKNGEWFELTREDIRAFRRRKFM